MGFMHAFFHGHQGGRQHGRDHHHHGFGRRFHQQHRAHHRPDDGADGEAVIDRFASKVARRLDLNEAQIAHLRTLIGTLQQQRQAIRGGTQQGANWVEDVAGLFTGAQFDRQAAAALVDTRVKAIEAGVPGLLDAIAAFYDALDAEQQQVLRFLLRLGRRAKARRDGEAGAQ